MGNRICRQGTGCNVVFTTLELIGDYYLEHAGGPDESVRDQPPAENDGQLEEGKTWKAHEDVKRWLNFSSNLGDKAKIVTRCWFCKKMRWRIQLRVEVKGGGGAWVPCAGDRLGARVTLCWVARHSVTPHLSPRRGWDQGMHKRTFLAAPDEEETAYISSPGKARGKGECGLWDSVAPSESLKERRTQ